MAIKELKTRIALRTGDYAYWTTGAGKDIELYKGEVCVCTIQPKGHPYDDAGQETGKAHTAPTVLFKVADANGRKFADLDWVSGLAADVYAWAKKANPDWTDFPALPIEVVDPDAATKKFITKIEYADNKLTITRSNVAWSDIEKAPDFALAADLGDVQDLTTTATTAVGAINEHDIEIGDLTSLNTENKDNLVAAINEALQAVEVGGTGSVVTVAKETTPTEGSEVTYTVKQGGKAVDVKIEIPKYDTEADYGVLEIKGDAASGVEVDKTDAQRPIVKIKANTYDAHGAAGDVKTGIENGTIKAKTAEHADAATKVDKALTVKVGGADVVYDGSAEKLADVDAAIAAALAEEGHPEYSIAKVTTTTGYSATYQLTKDGTAVGAKIDIPKDMVVSKGEVITYENAGAWGNAGTYIVLTLANAANDTLYIPAAGLIEYVTSGSTADSQVIVAIDENHKVTATIGAGKVTATELAQAVKDDIAKGVEAQGWGDHANAGYAKAGDLHAVATSGQYGDLEGRPTLGALAAKDNITHDLVTDFDAAVKAVKVDAAVDADKLGGVVAADYLKKSEAEGYADILTKTAAQGIYQPKGNYATADQGGKADTALQEIEPGIGLKVSAKKDNKQTIDIDDEVIFVLNANF